MQISLKIDRVSVYDFWQTRAKNNTASGGMEWKWVVVGVQTTATYLPTKKGEEDQFSEGSLKWAFESEMELKYWTENQEWYLSLVSVLEFVHTSFVHSLLHNVFRYVYWSNQILTT